MRPKAGSLLGDAVKLPAEAGNLVQRSRSRRVKVHSSRLGEESEDGSYIQPQMSSQAHNTSRDWPGETPRTSAVATKAAVASAPAEDQRATSLATSHARSPGGTRCRQATNGPSRNVRKATRASEREMGWERLVGGSEGARRLRGEEGAQWWSHCANQAHGVGGVVE